MNRRTFFATLFALPAAAKVKPAMGRPCLTINRLPEFISGTQIKNYHKLMAEAEIAMRANLKSDMEFWRNNTWRAE